MDNFILLVNNDVDVHTMQSWFRPKYEFRRESENVIHYSTTTVFMTIIDGEDMSGFDDDEISTVTKLIPHPNPFVVDSDDFYLAKEIIALIPEEINILLDNDHGKIFRRDDFLKMNSFKEFYGNES